MDRDPGQRDEPEITARVDLPIGAAVVFVLGATLVLMAVTARLRRFAWRRAKGELHNAKPEKSQKSA